MADAADAEAGRDCQLSRIQDVPAFLHAVVEDLEVEGWISGHLEGNDDRCLQIVGEQGLEPEGAHAVDDDAAVT